MEFRYVENTIVRDYLYMVTITHSDTNGGKPFYPIDSIDSVDIPEISFGEETFAQEFLGVGVVIPESDGKEIKIRATETSDGVIQRSIPILKDSIYGFDKKTKRQHINKPNEYPFTIQVEIFHLNGIIAMKHIFSKCGFKNISPLNLSYDNTNAIKFDIGFKIGRWETEIFDDLTYKLN